MGEDLLSVVFLALVCIVIAGIVNKIAPEGMMMPSFALIAICLWVAYDYIMLKRYQAKKACDSDKKHTHTKQHSDVDDLDKKIEQLEEEVGRAKPSSLKNDPEEHNVKRPQAKHENEFDIAMYDRELSVKELYKDMGCAGDTRLSNRMKYMALQPRMSKDIHSRLNSEKLRPFYEEELDDNENSEWWNVENDYLDNLM